jgi:hypothetical protein
MSRRWLAVAAAMLVLPTIASAQRGGGNGRGFGRGFGRGRGGPPTWPVCEKAPRVTKARLK